MLNRRGMLLGGVAAAAASPAIVTSPRAGSIPVLGKRFVINPHRQHYEGDAMITVDDILLAEFIRFGNDDANRKNWFQVLTNDGRTIQTELFGTADKVRSLHLMNELRNLGVKIYVRNYA
jgi:hypothetical protein